MLLATYVDDLLLFGPIEQEIDAVMANLCSRFKMKVMSSVDRYLGMNICYDRKSGLVTLDQSDKIEALARMAGVLDSNSPKSPMEESTPREAGASEAIEGKAITDYRAIVGSLMHISCYTRPDIAFAAGVLGRYMASPTVAARQAANRVVAFALSTKQRKLTLRRETKAGSLFLRVYSDSDFCGSESSKSTSGLAIFLGSTLVSWKSQRQTFVAHSTCEAEFIAMTEAAREGLWLSGLLAFIATQGAQIRGPTLPVVTDNCAAKMLAEGSGHKGRTKHITLRYDSLREMVRNQDIEVSRVATNEMPADGFTKALSPIKFDLFLDLISDRPEIGQSSS